MVRFWVAEYKSRVKMDFDLMTSKIFEKMNITMYQVSSLYLFTKVHKKKEKMKKSFQKMTDLIPKLEHFL